MEWEDRREDLEDGRNGVVGRERVGVWCLVKDLERGVSDSGTCCW